MPSRDSEELKRHADQILQEIRIVLPGTQALMGFQFIAFFNPVFQNMADELKQLHFAALILTILCSILLIAPVAFQQIGESGRVTRKFLSYTRRVLTGAMLCLLVAISADVYLASRLTGSSTLLAGAIALTLFGTGLFLWFIHALLRRSNHKK
jgi:hypothetical protein